MKLCGSAATSISLAVAAALALSAPRVYAADATASTDSGGLEEIVITSRKREENLQEVPLSVDVFSQRDLKNLGIQSFDDYAQKQPSISFVSVGPGTQVMVMRGVSDGSNPNYSNSSSTGVFLDDAALSSASTQPDLHLYDLERIEVLNGPQGTTFGAGSMAGAVRYITNKPNVNDFSLGLDADGGKIQGGQVNQSYEAFLNAPLIPGVLGLRFSAFSTSRGGYIDNKLTTRTWVNGVVSNNAEWAGNNYNREHEEGGRIALKGVINEDWSATLQYDYQRQSTRGAYDEDLANVGPRAVDRFGPERRTNQSKIAQFHLDGDVGIADLVFASTYWQLPTRQYNEYSEYMQNAFGGSKEGATCTNDPVFGTGPYTGCKTPTQFFEYHTNTERWSEEVRLQSKPHTRFNWLLGYYWERSRDKNSGSTFYVPGLNPNSPTFQYYLQYYGATQSSLPSKIWYSYTTKSDYLQTTEFANISFNITDKLNVEAGAVHFTSRSSYYSPYGQLAYAPTTPSYTADESNKVNTKAGINYKVTDHILTYALFSQGFRDGGSNSGYPQGCYANGVPNQYVPDTLNNFEIGWKTSSLQNRLTWNGAAYLMNWKDLQTTIYDVNICAPSSFNVNVGKARIYGFESNLDFKLDENWSFEGSGSYTDSHLIGTSFTTFLPNVGERLPFVPYFSYSFNVRYEHPLASNLKGYAQFDLAHKGDMWDDLHVAGANGFPRVLQPSYSIMNLRFGVNPQGGRWSAEFYITNLADKNAIVYTNTGNYDLRETTNEPRVYGIHVNYRMGKEVNSD